jgi:hypothetical protein
MPPAIHQRPPQQNSRTLGSLLLLKEKSPRSPNLGHSQCTDHAHDNTVQDISICLLQSLLVAPLLTLDKHLRAVIANEALEHALGRAAAAGDSVMATVITKTL